MYQKKIVKMNHPPLGPTNPTIETHPLEPFLPPNARLLMLGTFPPPRVRWSMEFYYPNFQNDMWRIFGLVFFDNKNHFLKDPKHFDREMLEEFLRQKGIAFSDTAFKVRRLRQNASDQFLEIVETIDLPHILSQIPHCQAICTAGEKASKVLASILPTLPGNENGSMNICHFRMPSSSRAFPKPLKEKAEIYASMFRTLGYL